MDISPTLHQPAHHLVCCDDLCDCGTFRAQLGDGAVQMLDLTVYHICIAGLASGSQPVLAFPDLEDCMEDTGEQRHRGRKIR